MKTFWERAERGFKVAGVKESNNKCVNSRITVGLPVVVSQQQSLAARTRFGRIVAAEHGRRSGVLLVN